MGPELVGLKANEWTYKRGIYGQGVPAEVIKGAAGTTGPERVREF